MWRLSSWRGSERGYSSWAISEITQNYKKTKTYGATCFDIKRYCETTLILRKICYNTRDDVDRWGSVRKSDVDAWHSPAIIFDKWDHLVE